MDAIEQKTWTPIPGHEMYDVSMDYRVRSWKVLNKLGQRADQPRVMRGHLWTYQTYYTLDGKNISLADILSLAYGPDHAVDYMQALDRDLSWWQVAEIRECEGLKYARDVAKDFRIDTFRVRRIWDGGEQ